jgi:hypothetical protein
MLAGVALVALGIVTYMVVDLKVFSHHPRLASMSFARQQLDHAEYGDILRMDDGSVAFVFASNGAGVSIIRCVNCSVQLWLKDNLSMHLDNIRPIEKNLSDDWHSEIDQWIAQKH